MIVYGVLRGAPTPAESPQATDGTRTARGRVCRPCRPVVTKGTHARSPREAPSCRLKCVLCLRPGTAEHEAGVHAWFCLFCWQALEEHTPRCRRCGPGRPRAGQERRAWGMVKGCSWRPPFSGLRSATAAGSSKTGPGLRRSQPAWARRPLATCIGVAGPAATWTLSDICRGRVWQHCGEVPGGSLRRPAGRRRRSPGCCSCLPLVLQLADGRDRLPRAHARPPGQHHRQAAAERPAHCESRRRCITAFFGRIPSQPGWTMQPAAGVCCVTLLPPVRCCLVSDLLCILPRLPPAASLPPRVQAMHDLACPELVLVRAAPLARPRWPCGARRSTSAAAWCGRRPSTSASCASAPSPTPAAAP